MTKSYTCDNVTINDIRRALTSNGLSLLENQTKWNGDHVKVWITGLNPWAMRIGSVLLKDIVAWLNQDSGFYDPISMGM